MRDIRFRAFIESKNRMAYGSTDGSEQPRWVLSLPIEIEKMQYTGLEDKNGIPIYEGDIVENLSYFYGPSEVVFHNGRFTVYQESFGYMIDVDWFNDCIVIGNKWDNPELLTDKNK